MTGQSAAGPCEKVRAFWVMRPGRGRIRSQPMPPVAPGEVVVRSRYGGVSRGTETLVFRGEVPDRLAGRMRCPFQEGEFPGPVKYGYSTVGTVISGPGRGREVFALHPHQDVMVLPEDASRPLPRGVPPSRAVLAPGMETALNALWDARPDRDQQVCVVGAGVIGLLVGYLARRLAGARVEVVDLKPARGEVARRLGLGFAGEPRHAGTLLFHASGTPAGLRACLAAAGFEARIVELSWYGTRPVTLPLGEDFHDRRLSIISSQVGVVAPRYRVRWSRARRLDRALELLRDERLDALIDSEGAFEDLPADMVELSAGRRAALCHRVVYPAA
ncbi:MAG: zinc-binding alcohol dehydrogenase [Alphaproteobacteria bacterium]|nr:zinc-binding alcohol dehydrogenase [Alphaproteobacteria bacterium]